MKQKRKLYDLGILQRDVNARIREVFAIPKKSNKRMRQTLKGVEEHMAYEYLQDKFYEVLREAMNAFKSEQSAAEPGA